VYTAWRRSRLRAFTFNNTNAYDSSVVVERQRALANPERLKQFVSEQGRQF
jgi:phage-related protein